MSLAILLIASYLVGAFPSSIVYGKLFRKVDVRNHGSGNAGGTNAWRVLGWKIGLPVMITDVAKGALASVFIARIPLGPLPFAFSTVALLCGLAAVIGHVFPVYTRFRGGKGVATGAGMLVGNAPIPVACALGVFAIVVFLFGKISLGSILAAVSLPISVFLIDRFTIIDYPILLLVLTIALALFIITTHWTNIRRLLKGEEKAFENLQLWKKILRPRQ
ncbi:glycerol-3-phosphate 1-O-acyltransferase PlsY [Candidatus Bipolaricaulota bacterium]|nr:glycerol-3-phosphate 1-O-acyltransferase PlsY [Candidatus Bipolaricaulota bacterium]TFH10846.1 MAG: glycerol-3-phosphate 1-O-acyltransferase PlsY [Candidatus Atribacteria bacterium]